jgi:hypothetical protein
MMERPAREYIMDIKDWSAQVFDNVDWIHIYKPLHRCLGSKCITAHKLMFCIIPTLVNHYKRNGERSLNRRCPRYYTTFHHKDFEYIFHYTAPSAVTLQATSIASFSTKLEVLK